MLARRITVSSPFGNPSIARQFLPAKSHFLLAADAVMRYELYRSLKAHDDRHSCYARSLGLA